MLKSTFFEEKILYFAGPLWSRLIRKNLSLFEENRAASPKIALFCGFYSNVCFIIKCLFLTPTQPRGWPNVKTTAIK